MSLTLRAESSWAVSTRLCCGDGADFLPGDIGAIVTER